METDGQLYVWVIYSKQTNLHRWLVHCSPLHLSVLLYSFSLQLSNEPSIRLHRCLGKLIDQSTCSWSQEREEEEKNSKVINYRCSCNYNFAMFVYWSLWWWPLRHEFKVLFSHVFSDKSCFRLFILFKRCRSISRSLLWLSNQPLVNDHSIQLLAFSLSLSFFQIFHFISNP